MSEFYQKYKHNSIDFQGKKYFEKSFVVKRMDNLLDTSQRLQRRSHEAENLLMDVKNNWLVRLLFGKKIKKHFEKYKNFNLKF